MSYQDIIPLVLAEIVGDFGYKEFANKGGFSSFFTGTAGYIAVGYFLIRSLQGSTILTVNSAWDGISTIIENIAAYIFFGERFENWNEYLGMILIVVGLLFMKIPATRKEKFVFPELFSTKNK
jgi:hypothetical protein